MSYLFKFLHILFNSNNNEEHITNTNNITNTNSNTNNIIESIYYDNIPYNYKIIDKNIEKLRDPFIKYV